MKITAIKAQVKRPERVSVYIDEKYALSLNHTQLLEQKLRVGLEIDEPRLQELKRAGEFGKAYERALQYVMLRPRSMRELQDYCRRKKWPPEDCQAIMQKLVERRYVDDTKFARAWVEARAAGKKTSERKLKLELKQKGVSDEIISQTLAQTGYDEHSALRALVAKKRKLARYRQDSQKLMQYLVRQGFGFDEVKKALQEENHG